VPGNGLRRSRAKLLVALHQTGQSEQAHEVEV